MVEINELLFPTLHDKKGRVKNIYESKNPKYDRDGKFTQPNEPLIVTISSGVTRDFSSEDWSGMWLHMDYSAAFDGPQDKIRRDNLRKIFVCTFIPEENADISYIEEFGEPMSEKRREKILRYLNSQIADKKDDSDMMNAVKKWERDKKWFIGCVG